MDNPQNPQIESSPVSKTLALWRKWRMLVFGFVGWFLFEGLFWLLMNPGSEEELAICNSIPLLITFIVLIVLTVNKPYRQAALGILTAMAVNLIISLIKSMAVNGFCFIPFFIE